MDFSLPLKRYDTDGMFSSPPGPSSPTVNNRAHGQGLSKLDLIFARPGVLRHHGGGSSPSDGSSSSSSSRTLQGQQQLMASRPVPQTFASPAHSQRSNIIVNTREPYRGPHPHLESSRDDSPASSRTSSGILANGSGSVGRSMQGGNGSGNNGSAIRSVQSGSGLGASGSGSQGRPLQDGAPLRFHPSGTRTQNPSSMRQPPTYDSLRYLQSPGRSGNPVGQRMSLRPSAPVQARPFKFAPPKLPPPLPQRTEPPRQIRDYVIHSNASSASSVAGRSGTHDPDTLAKISELAKITRASIPMSPLEDEAEVPARREHTASHNALRELMPPPATRAAVRTPSPSGSRVMSAGGGKEVMSTEAMNAVASQLGIQVEVVHKLTPPPPITMTLRSRFPALQETNLGFSNFASAVAFLTLDEPPLNPLEIESSKDVLISIFGPKMTLYRCGGCESTFVFRSVFSDHLYRGIVPYRLRCAHCKDTLAFTNVCQVKEHVRSHGYTNFQLAKGFVLTVAEINDENIQPGESMGARLAAEQLAKSTAQHSVAVKGMSVVGGASSASKAPKPSANRMLQEMLKRTDDLSDVPRRAPSLLPPQPTFTPLRNSAAHALQRLRQQVEAQEMMKAQADFVRPSLPTVPAGQMMRQVIRNNSNNSAPVATTSFDTSRGAPKVLCPYCRSTFDGQSGITHHFQRFKDVTDAASNYRCKECKVVCCNQCSFDAHQKIHRLSRQHPNMTDVCCPECGLRLTTLDDITSHVERRCVHWCRMLCSSFNCCMPNCRYCSTSEDDYFAHMVNEHSGQPDGKNVCPVCRVQINGPRTILVEHLASGNACRARILQQKSMFFAYHCVYCEEKSAPVFETKAAMRDHIAHVHAAGLPKSAVWGSQAVQLPSTAGGSGSGNFVSAHAKRIASFSEFESTFKRPTVVGGGSGSGSGSGGGIVNSLLARRSAETATVGGASGMDGGYGKMFGRQTFPQDGRPTSQAPSPVNSTIIQNLSLLKRTLAEEDAKSSTSKRPRPTGFGCQMCTFEGASHEELANHTELHHTRELTRNHTEPSSASSSSSTSQHKTSSSTTAARYDCKVCEMERGSFSCDSQAVFHDHVRREHPAKDSSFQCSECALQLLSLSVLQMHMRVNHGIMDPNAFFAGSTFYAGMRAFRQQPLAGPVNLTAAGTAGRSSLFQHSSSSSSSSLNG